MYFSQYFGFPNFRLVLESTDFNISKFFRHFCVTRATFRSEYEYDYEYEFSVLSTRCRFKGRNFSKCACSELKTRTRSRPRAPI